MKTSAVLIAVITLTFAGCHDLQAPADPADPAGPTRAEELGDVLGAGAAFLPPPWNFIVGAIVTTAGTYLGYRRGKVVGSTKPSS